MQISGTVIKGAGYGRKIGFPTANIDRRQFVRLKRKPKLGVYAGRVYIGSTSPGLRPPSPLKERVRVYKAGIVIGPLDSKSLPKLEAHLINFKGNLYGKKITLEPSKYLRPFANYRGEQQLISQIRKDIKKIKSYIS